MAFQLDGDGRVGDVVVLLSEARVDDQAPPAHQNPPDAAEYAEGFERVGPSGEQFAATYPVALRLRPVRLRGH